MLGLAVIVCLSEFNRTLGDKREMENRMMNSLTTSNHAPSMRRQAIAIMAALFITICALTPVAHATSDTSEHSADLKVFTPRNGDLAGVAGKGFFVDLRARFDGDLASTYG